ncbi:DUF3916 domain-containing protein [Acinetobacter haemolyticus]|uniref:DUF3916 domain-containing protein n=1 Tax=Acinetobacter haemolyticus TaxID=29430 RepID=A0AAW4J1P9_ACIHA|nr:DUF3916 domain-containing protein [Acinetobacter haemolyticus]MBO3656872.1 DUF3916 domain-containing protein [Acinetobacter haemolyticus]MQZ29429.1 DUF3916 domain-containing protein [Acinetobacter haemolyticus]
MRRFALSNKKERGIPRKLRNLRLWSESFKGYFPDLEGYEERYYNWKIPVAMNLVQGKHAQQEIKALCAQYLINACQYLIEAKPVDMKFCKVVCVIIQPDMFASEICLYLDEDYFNSHTLLAEYYDPQYLLADDMSLSRRWGLEVPEKIKERGIHIHYVDLKDVVDNYITDQWYFIEE